MNMTRALTHWIRAWSTGAASCEVIPDSSRHLPLLDSKFESKVSVIPPSVAQCTVLRTYGLKLLRDSQPDYAVAYVRTLRRLTGIMNGRHPLVAGEPEDVEKTRDEEEDEKMKDEVEEKYGEEDKLKKERMEERVEEDRIGVVEVVEGERSSSEGKGKSCAGRQVEEEYSARSLECCTREAIRSWVEVVDIVEEDIQREAIELYGARLCTAEC